ncbi:Uncharacterised protein [Mycobacteroides abscessus]|nr:Uncharacterised protein [Mycobacteroides abscessus]
MIGHHQRGAALARNLVCDLADGDHHRVVLLNTGKTCHPGEHRIGGALADLPALDRVQSAHSGGSGEGHEFTGHRLLDRPGRQLHDAASLRGLVGEARGPGRRSQGFVRNTWCHQKFRGLTVAEGDGAGLVHQQCVDIAGGLDGTSGLGQHIVLHQAVHTRDADRGHQRTDCGGDQADEQRDQLDRILLLTAVIPHGSERDNRQQENDGERCQQDVECDLVGGLLTRSTLHKRNHPIYKRFSWGGGDLHDDAVREHGGTTGDGAAVATGFTDNRCGLTGDGRLVHGGNAFHHIAVTGYYLPRLYHDAVTRPQRAARDFFLVLIAVTVPDQSAGDGVALDLS